MKKQFLIITILFSSIYIYAQKPKVLATTTMIADMAQNIIGDRLAVESLLPLGGDPHIYEPTPTDVQKVTQAQLILMNGLTLEGWMKELINNSGTKAQLCTVTEGVRALISEQHQGSADPHAWMSASNGIIYARNIKDAAIKLDPQGKDIYEKNYKVYEAQLTELGTYIKNKIAQIPYNQRILITSHDAFEYYGLENGLRLESALGTSTDADVQTSDIIRLIKVIKESGISAIFVESTINPKLLKQIAKDNKVIIGGKLFADSLGDEQTGANTYIGMLKTNTDIITSALTQPKAAIVATYTEGGGLAVSKVIGFLSFITLCGFIVYFVSKFKIGFSLQS